MKVHEGINKLGDFIKQAEKDDDCYCLVHFSRTDDRFEAYHQMDMGDALIIIQRLCHEFGIDKRAL